MKTIIFIVLILATLFSYSQEVDWIQTQGEITKITVYHGKRTRESAIVKFHLEDGTEQFATTELLRIPMVGSMKSVGDKITINYHKNKPYIAETTLGKLISNFGMFALILLGIIFSIKQFLKNKKTQKFYF